MLFSKTEITLKSLIILINLIVLKVNRKDKSVISKLEIKANSSGKEITTNKKQYKPARCNYSESGYVDIAMGVGGVSVRADFFDDICFEIPEILWPDDDIWLSGNFIRQGKGIWASNLIKMPVDTGASNISGLAHSIINGKHRNQTALDGILYMQKTYDIWK